MTVEQKQAAWQHEWASLPNGHPEKCGGNTSVHKELAGRRFPFRDDAKYENGKGPSNCYVCFSCFEDGGSWKKTNAAYEHWKATGEFVPDNGGEEPLIPTLFDPSAVGVLNPEVEARRNALIEEWIESAYTNSDHSSCPLCSCGWNRTSKDIFPAEGKIPVSRFVHPKCANEHGWRNTMASYKNWLLTGEVVDGAS